MELSKSQWHVRLYLWSRQTWLHFWGKEFREQRETQTNLCLYIRTLFVWMPLVVVIHLAVLTWLLYTFVYLPIATFGAVPFGIFLARVIGSLALAIGAIAGLFYLIDRFDRPLSR